MARKTLGSLHVRPSTISLTDFPTPRKPTFRLEIHTGTYKYMERSTTADYFEHNFEPNHHNSNTLLQHGRVAPTVYTRLVLSLPAEERSAVTGVGGRHGAHRVMHGDRQNLPTASVPEPNGLLVHLPLQRQRVVEMAHKARVDSSQNVPGVDGRPNG